MTENQSEFEPNLSEIKEQSENQPNSQENEREIEAEFGKLNEINEKVSLVQHQLIDRFPSRYRHLAGFVCGVIWSLSLKKNKERREGLIRKIRMELGTFEYQSKEQAEILTQKLCDLDNILSYGHKALKEKRKAMVLKVQELTILADNWKRKSEKLALFGENLIARNRQKFEFEENDMENNECEQTAIEIEPFTENETIKESNKAENEQRNQETETELKAEEKSNSIALEASHPIEPQPQYDAMSLPIWKPYYQIQRHAEGITIYVNLRGVKAEHIEVKTLPETGVIRISGVKLPSEKEFALTQFSGIPTFGRFEIIERFPAHLLQFDSAMQRLRPDGVLEVHLPYYYMPSQSQFPFNFYAMHPSRRCLVW